MIRNSSSGQVSSSCDFLLRAFPRPCRQDSICRIGRPEFLVCFRQIQPEAYVKFEKGSTQTCRTVRFGMILTDCEIWG